MATNDERIEELAQSIYIARHNQSNDVTGTDLTDFLDQTIEWVNQYIRELEKKAYWNFSRTRNDTIGTISDIEVVSYPLASTIRTLVIHPMRDLTIRQDGTVVSTFKMVNPNQVTDPTDLDIRDRATVVGRNVIFSRELNSTELNGDIVADSIAWLPNLTHDDVSLLDILDEYLDIRQLVVFGVLKNQVLPDIVQGGLTPTFAVKYDDMLQDCLDENKMSADTDDVDQESFADVGGIGW